MGDVQNAVENGTLDDDPILVLLEMQHHLQRRLALHEFILKSQLSIMGQLVPVCTKNPALHSIGDTHKTSTKAISKVFAVSIVARKLNSSNAYNRG